MERDGGTGTTGTEASKAVVSVKPDDGAKEVATSGVLKITSTGGKLTTVTVADTKGNAVEGKLAADGASWEPARNLASATEYKVHAVAKDEAGRESAKDTTFTTLTPANTFIGQYTPEDGSTVGVGMPVSINFSRGITNPEAVEKAITVTAEPSVPIEGHWFGNDRLDFRPENYWAAGTKVTLKLELDGVEGRPGSTASRPVRSASRSAAPRSPRSTPAASRCRSSVTARCSRTFRSPRAPRRRPRTTVRWSSARSTR